MATVVPIRVRNGEVTLGGTLHLPDGAGPYPALVMLQGPGPADRDNNGYFPPIRDHFVSRGLAVLSWDKPGIGESSGDWGSQTLADRAAEALRMLGWLRDQPQVDPRRVGIWGHSQGGWVGPLAASQDPDAAFLVIHSGPGIGPMEQDFYGIEHTLRQAGHGDDVVAQAHGFIRTLHAYAERGAPLAEVTRDVLLPAEGTPWGAYFGLLDESGWRFLTVNAQQPYDPVPALERIECPALAIFGERDALVPVARSIEIFRKAFAKAGNADVTIAVFPDANHRLQVGPERSLAPGYLATMSSWILARVSQRTAP